MAKRKKDKQEQRPAVPKGAGSGARAARPRGGPGSPGSGKAARPRGLAGWYRAKSPIFRFVVVLGVLMVAANLGLATETMRDTVIPKYLEGWAHISAGVLRVFGEKASVMESEISSPRFTVNIKRGCDALQPTVLFITAVLASPVAWLPKLPGLLLGVGFLMVMNLVRVLSLFYIGIYWRAAFETMHHDVWQAVFIIFSILAWALWALWAVRKSIPATHVAR